MGRFDGKSVGGQAGRFWVTVEHAECELGFGSLGELPGDHFVRRSDLWR